MKAKRPAESERSSRKAKEVVEKKEKSDSLAAKKLLDQKNRKIKRQRMAAAPSAAASVPVIDISPFAKPEEHEDAHRAACAVQWDEAMTNVGFAFIVGHGVEKGTIEALRSGFKGFFENNVRFLIPH